MRRGERTGEVFDRLLARGEIRIHATEVERRQALTLESGLVIADTHEQVDALNAAIRHGRVVARGGRPPRERDHIRGERIGVGDRIATRRNDRDLDVANRDTWTVTAVDPDGGLQVADGDRRRRLPTEYVERCVELAYASTAYGAQGQTVDTAHVVIGEHTSAAAAYVAMTRGRSHNTAHIVADSVADARAQWTAVFARDGADLGPAHAAARPPRTSTGTDLHCAAEPQPRRGLDTSESPRRRSPIRLQAHRPARASAGDGSGHGVLSTSGRGGQLAANHGPRRPPRASRDGSVGCANGRQPESGRKFRRSWPISGTNCCLS